MFITTVSTVSSPFRLREGLVTLSRSILQGKLRGGAQEIAFCRLLEQHGIVELGEEETYSIGQNWRSALGNLGFLYPEIPASSGISQAEVGPLDMITPNGWRLIRADTVPAMQECFLRALAAHFIPSPLDRDYAFSVFSPLRHTLAVLLALEARTGESRLNFIEMSLVVQLTTTEDDMEEIVDQVMDLRAHRLAAINKEQFDREALAAATETHGYTANTFNDYADTNFRYLKATGLVRGAGRGVVLVLEKRVFIEQLVRDNAVPATAKDYFVTLCNGAALPTDNQAAALVVLHDLIHQVSSHLMGRPTDTPADIAQKRHYLEDLLFEANEEAYAARQAALWEEIAAYMELIATRGGGSTTLANGEEITVPRDEAPAYFEWVLWRAFLAINRLTNRPHDARRFRVDQDFLPVGTAPRNGPDLILEYDDFVIVVEVTLLTNSRTAADEVKPIRPNVADLVVHHAETTGKPVYGLFIANRIDLNTAESFRHGFWYTNNDEHICLDIIPIALADFKTFFETLFIADQVDADLVRTLLEQCTMLRPNHEAPGWIVAIAEAINSRVTQLLQCNTRQ